MNAALVGQRLQSLSVITVFTSHVQCPLELAGLGRHLDAVPVLQLAQQMQLVRLQVFDGRSRAPLVAFWIVRERKFEGVERRAIRDDRSTYRVWLKNDSSLPEPEPDD